MPSQTLSLMQSQRLQMILAPQLRQSLEMLQAPILELRTLIQNELQQNPTLEEISPETTPVDIEPGGGEVDSAKELNFEKEKMQILIILPRLFFILQKQAFLKE